MSLFLTSGEPTLDLGIVLLVEFEVGTKRRWI
jgi:hypothetical protein